MTVIETELNNICSYPDLKKNFLKEVNAIILSRKHSIISYVLCTDPTPTHSYKVDTEDYFWLNDFEFDDDCFKPVSFVCDAGGVYKAFGNEIQIPTFNMDVTPSFQTQDESLPEIKEKVLNKLLADMYAAEVLCLCDMSEKSAGLYNPITKLSPVITKHELLNIKCNIDRWSKVTNVFLMSPKDIEDIRDWKKIDFFGQRDVVEAGVIGMLWGAYICSSKVIPPGTVYAYAMPEHVGVIREKEKMSVLDIEKISENKYGVTAHQELGMAILYPKYTAMGRK
jgi:hypothetical protein